MAYEHTEPGPEPGPELPDRDEGDEGDDAPRVWCDFDLETIPTAHVWNRGSFEWALTVNLELVNTLVREHLDELTPTLGGARLVATTHWAALSAADQEGLASLYREPPYATTLQISGGGHRFAAIAPARSPVGARPVPRQRRRRRRP